MKKITKNYLKLCAINAAEFLAIWNLLVTRLKDDGYEFVKTKRDITEDAMDAFTILVVMLTPAVNVIVTSGAAVATFGEEFYEKFKEGLLEKGIIKKIDENNIEQPKTYKKSSK